MYFSEFPYTLYRNEKNNLIILTDISKTFDITGSLNSSEMVTYSIKDGDTPESLSFQISNTTANSWIIMLMNRMIDTHYDWPMDSNTFNHFIEKKYGNKMSLFLEVSNTYGTFKEGDSVKIINEQGTQEAIATVSSWDRTYGNLVIQNYTGDLEQITENLKNKTKRYFAKVDSINIARIGRIVLVYSQALHHFEGQNKIYLDPHTGLLDSYSLFDSNEYVVTNYQYESDLNDSKRKIILPSPKLMEKIKKDFKDKVTI